MALQFVNKISVDLFVGKLLLTLNHLFITDF